MFRKEFAEVISRTGMIPVKDLRPLLNNDDKFDVTELKITEFEFFDDLKFAKVVAEKSGLTFIDLSAAKIPDSILMSIKKSDAIKHRCIPIQKTAKAVSVAVFDPSIKNNKQELQTLFQHNVELILTNIKSWQMIFDRMQDSLDDILETIREIKPDDLEGDNKDIKDEDIGDDVIRSVNKILAEAFVSKASDIHVEPYENIFRIRFRIDGTLQEISRPSSKWLHQWFQG